MSVSSLGATPTTGTSSAPLTGNAALQSAKAQYLRTGIDKDAAAGDPDHDAPRKVNLGTRPTAAPATQASSSAVTVANAVTPQSATSAAAAAAYSPKAKA